MSSRGLAASAAVVGWMLAASSLAAGASPEVESQIRDMQARMQRMEDQLQAASDQLDTANHHVEEQSQLIENSGLVQTRGASNGLPGFLGQIKVGGSVSATYLYNGNDPNDHDNGGLGGTNSGMNGAFYPLHPDHNSFAFQAAWFEIGRDVDEENRGGFYFETAYGKTGQLDNIGGLSNRDVRDDTGFYLSQGYVQYLAPIGDGVTFQMGKFATTIGKEVANSAYNWNITQGSVYQLLEPLDHIGIIASYAFGDSGFDAALGGVNGYFPDDPDRNDAKSILGHVGWASDKVSFGVNGMWGGEQTGFDGAESGVVNAVLSVQATDRLAFWIDGDYNWIDASGDPNAWGIAAAARFGITDRTGIALRGEYVADSDRFLGFCGFGATVASSPCSSDSPTDIVPTGFEVWDVTATVDHLLTDNLMIRGEVRYDDINKDSTDNAEFFQDSSDFDNDQIVVGVEAIYSFDKFGGE